MARRVEDKILALMKAPPKAQERTPPTMPRMVSRVSPSGPKSGGAPPEDRQFTAPEIGDRVQLKLVEALLSKHPYPKFENEVGFGRFAQGGGRDPNHLHFIPGVTAAQFYSLRDRLNEFGAAELSMDTIEISEKDYVRRIVADDGAVSYQRKIRDGASQFEAQEWGFRISSSTEEWIDAPSDFSPTVVRSRKRFVYSLGSTENANFEGMTLDLTHVIEKRIGGFAKPGASEEAKTKYEVEIEVVSRSVTALALLKAVQMVTGFLQGGHKGVAIAMAIDEREEITADHNRLFNRRNKDGTPYVYKSPTQLNSDYWNKPESLEIDHLLTRQINDFAVTVKFDGTRRLLYVKTHAVYGVSPPYDLWKLAARGAIAESGTLLDAEEYINEEGEVTFYVFDILFQNRRDVRQVYLHERLRMVRNAVAKLNYSVPELNVVVKHFETTGTFYDRTNAALRWMDEHPEMKQDGLIFQPKIWYRNSHTKKWKPSEQITIDFLFRRIGVTDEYQLLVSDRKSLVPFRADDFDGSLRVPGGTASAPDGLEFFVDGAVIECSWNAESQTFQIVRPRTDRDRPNAVFVARQVWKDIQNPIPRETIEGVSLQVMRRYHNRVKDRLLNGDRLRPETTFGQDGQRMWKNFAVGTRVAATTATAGKGRGVVQSVEGDVHRILTDDGSVLETKRADIVKIAEGLFAPGAIILDIGSGRGGDISKWSRGRFAKVFAVEPDETNRAELYRRLGLEKRGPMVRVLETGFENTDALVEAIGDDRLDGIVAFFSLTFFGKDPRRWRGLLQSIDKTLPEGAKLVGIVMDGDRVRSAIEKIHITEDIPTDESADVITSAFQILQDSRFSAEGGLTSAEIELMETEARIDRLVEMARLKAAERFDEDVLVDDARAAESEVAFRKSIDRKKENLEKLREAGKTSVAELEKKRLAIEGEETRFLAAEKQRKFRQLEDREQAIREFALLTRKNLEEKMLGSVVKSEIEAAENRGHRVEEGRNQIVLKINEAVTSLYGGDEGQTEWLFYFDLFVAELKALGIHLAEDYFLDRPTDEYLALPPDSKLFSSFNHVFIFERREPEPTTFFVGEKAVRRRETEATRRKTTTKVVSEIKATETQKLAVREKTKKMLPDARFRGGPLGDEEGVLITVSSGPSAFVHAVLRAATAEYKLATPKERVKMVRETRREMADLITPERFASLNESEIAQSYATRTVTGAKAASEFAARVADPKRKLDYRVATELISELMEVDVVTYSEAGDELPVLCSGVPSIRKHDTQAALLKVGEEYRVIALDEVNTLLA